MPTTYKKVALVAPTINEVEALRVVVPRLKQVPLDEIIVVDLNSTDGTVAYAQAEGLRVHHQQSRGYGAAFMEALSITDADVLIEFCPDGSSLPETIPLLLAKIDEGYDFVIASRYRDGAVSYDDDIMTRFGNWLFTTMVNVLFKAHYTDVLVGYKVYRREALKKLHLDEPGMAWAVQMPIRFTKIGARVTEVGSDEPARIGGSRKMKPFKTGMQILRTIVKEYRNGKRFLNGQ